MEAFFLAVDVGTSSVRSAIFDNNGKLINKCIEPLTIWNNTDFYEQSSSEIWSKVCSTIKTITSNVDKKKIKGIGFDATCSMVVLDENFNGLSVSETDDPRCDIIMWMDHRAKKEMNFINSKNNINNILKFVGGKISLEMQIPKLLWLKLNKPESFNKAKHFMDLTDFLTFKATGSTARSLCSLVCKWTYINSDSFQGWDETFFKNIGLEEFIEENFQRIGNHVKKPGSFCGGLNTQTANDFDLFIDMPVATSLIDAHAGTLGCLSCETNSGAKLDEKLVIIAGTSACHMILNAQEFFINGVWGPYKSVIFDGLYLNEAGQSAVAKLLDYIIDSHCSKSWIEEKSEEKNKHPVDIITEILAFVSSRENICITELVKDFHICPDFHGNRSPLADSSRLGCISGMTLNKGVEDLALKYLATLQALAYGTRHIIETIKNVGINIKEIYMCGGLVKNRLFLQTVADVCGVNIVVPNCEDPVLFGSSILAAVASGYVSSLQEGIKKFQCDSQTVTSNDKTKGFHDKKYKVFLKMQQDQADYKIIMNSSS